MPTYQTLSPNIGVKSVQETVSFYTEILGFKLVTSVPSANGELQWAMLNNGKATFMFQEADNLAAEYPALAERPLLGAITFYIKMKNMHLLYEALQGTRHIAKEMHRTFYGADEYAIFDNNGHILTISEDKAEPDIVKDYDNFFLPIEDYQASIHFYSEVLELEKKFEFAEQGMVAFKVGEQEPAIILKDKTKMPGSVPTIWFEVDDVRILHEKMKQKGVAILSEPFHIRTGWAFEFADPSGNRLGFTDYRK